MSQKFEIVATVREDQGKGASRRLRRTGNIPAVVYGAGKDPVALTLVTKDISKNLESEVFYTSILTLIVDGASEKTVLRDVQRHPASEEVFHIDLMRINANVKLHVHVPVHLINAEECEGIRLGGQVNRLMADVEVVCLPADIPEFLEIDLSSMEVGESIHLSEIKMAEGVEVAVLMLGDDHDQAIVSLVKGRVEE